MKKLIKTIQYWKLSFMVFIDMLTSCSEGPEITAQVEELKEEWRRVRRELCEMKR